MRIPLLRSKWDEEAAMEMALKCFEWRRDFYPGGVAEITEEQVEGEAAKGVGYFHGFARNGRKRLIWCQ